MSSPSRRSLLAGLWSLVGLLTTAGFVIAISFAIASQKYDPNYSNGNYYNNDDRGGEEDRDNNQNNKYGVITVTSRAMVFAAIWTAILSGMLVIYGTVLLGVRMPFTGKYYSCCTGSVHRMTPLTLGSFAGSLLMFANLTIVSAILFGEFQVCCIFDIDVHFCVYFLSISFFFTQHKSLNVIHYYFLFSVLCLVVKDNTIIRRRRRSKPKQRRQQHQRGR